MYDFYVTLHVSEEMASLWTTSRIFEMKTQFQEFNRSNNYHIV